MVFKIVHRGSFDNTERFLNAASKLRIEDILNTYGQEGVSALSSVTPVDSGETADSWTYQIVGDKTSFSIIFSNTNMTESGTPIAILLQYGHGTRNGGWVQGRDYINPAIQPIFDRIAEDVWREVTKK